MGCLIDVVSGLLVIVPIGCEAVYVDDAANRGLVTSTECISAGGHHVPLAKVLGNQTTITHPPGLSAGDHFAKYMSFYVAPWPAEEYWTLYESCHRLIKEVDPALIIIDTFFSPAIDAARNERRLHALITPNILSDMLDRKSVV